MKKIILKKGKEASVLRFHPWIFSGAIYSKPEDIEDGDPVEVYSAGDQYLASGHYQNGSIMVRICTFEKTNLKQNFWTRKIQKAFQVRQLLNLAQSGTNCYRLIHGEGDGLPGLIIDIYDKTAVVQCHSIGMYYEREKIAQALQLVFGEALNAIYDKSTTSLPPAFAATIQNDYLLGNGEDSVVMEYNHQFSVNWITGQKTGFFLDQRENRNLLAHYATGKKVLNAFCYSGGFSIYALKAGAQLVHSVDVSQKAMDLTDQNIQINAPYEGTHQSFTSDVMTFLKESETEYDLMIVDPPAFAKSISKRHNAVQGYKRLNSLALQKIGKNSLLFTFSCSQVVDEKLFYNTIVAAAIEANRKVSVLHRLTQPADHPVSLFHPEGSYLKGLVLYVE
ncbi:MAG: 23S rRNA (cytosine1962-C5)-methyltransferase [Saprospiraceae bacterium]